MTSREKALNPMRAIVLVIVAILAVGVSLELGGGKGNEEKTNGHCEEFVENIESQVEQGKNGHQSYLEVRSKFLTQNIYLIMY